MRNRVSFEMQQATVNDSGEAVYTYSGSVGDGNIPAAIRNITRRMTTNADVSQPLGETTYEIRIRYREGLTIGDHVKFTTAGVPGYTPAFVVIRGIENVREIDHELILTCEVADQ